MFENLFAKQGLSMGRLHAWILLSESGSQPEVRERILSFLHKVLHVDPADARVLPCSELDNAKVGKRVPKHPLYDAYIGQDRRSARGDFYAKSEPGALVPEINEPVASAEKESQRPFWQQPLPRVQRVFTTPIKHLVTEWRSTSQRLRSEPPQEEI